MPYIYCPKCNGKIDDWREAFKGCKHCGFEYFKVDDPNTRGVMRAMLDEIVELKGDIKELREELKARNHIA
ncbi:MAG: hypothetical protein JRE23_08775 [Deltaproteobacteria bacterium]|nr:hypothetical protein [Deltaproteobacteria bacterium]